MKKFLILIFTFTLPIVLLLFTFEYLLRSIPNDYSYKSNYLDKNADQLEVLFLGNSHVYYGIDPAFLNKSSFNASHIAQPIDYDYEILNKYKKKLNKIKYIVLPVDYFTFYNRLENGKEKWRKKNYNIYYGFYKSHNPFNYLEILNGTVWANSKRVIKNIQGKQYDLLCNTLGWGTIYKSLQNKDLVKTATREASIQKAPNSKYYYSSIEYLKKIIKCTQELNATLILITSPVHREYLSRIDISQMNNTLQVANKYAKEFPNVVYCDFLKDKSFVDKEFYDADHLNEKGAKKFSLKIDSVIRSLDARNINRYKNNILLD